MTGDTIEQSDSGMKYNPDLLQQSEVANYDAYLTADAGKIHEGNDNMNISMEEDQETVKQQNTLRLDVKNIVKTKKKYGDQYMKLFMPHFLKKQICSKNILDLCKKIQINLSLYHLVSK